MLAHRCGERGCRKYIPTEKRYCDEHAKLHIWKPTKKEKSISDKRYNEHSRDEESNSFYHSKEWTRMRDFVYSRDLATCQVCGEAISDRKIVDHVHALKVAPEEKLDDSNLWVLCYRCHNIKTKGEQKIAQSINGTNKLKHISREWWIKTIKERIYIH